MNTSAFIQFVLGFFLLTSLLAACHQIDEEDLTGYWSFQHGIPSPEGSIYAFKFSENRVEFEGKHGFWYEGSYQIKNQAIQIKTESDYELNWPITNLEQDTLQLRDSATYMRFADQHQNQLGVYALMNLPSIDTLASKKMVGIIHFFKNADGQPRLGLADKITEIRDFVLYLDGPRYKQSPLEILLFLDKNILLSDLWELHINLAQQRHNKINVVMNHTFPQAPPIFKYKIHFWEEDLELV